MTGSTLLRRYIGRRFEALRDAAGLNQEQAGRLVERSRIWIARIEDGVSSVRFRRLEIEALLRAYGADDAAIQLLLALTREVEAAGKSASWWHDYSNLPSWFALYISLEDAAASIHQYSSELVPGLLQTRAYAEQVMTVPAGYVSPDEHGHLVDIRVSRQALLTRRDAPQVHVVLSEAALWREVGGPVAMREQLTHLIELAQRPNVSLRVLPFAVGAHGGMGCEAGAFSLLEFPADPRANEPLEPPLVFVDTLTGAVYMQKPGEVAAYRLAWDDIDKRALDERATQEMISTVRERMTDHDQR